MSKPVLVIGDTHAPCMLKGYVPFLKKIQKKHDCGRVVHIGDVVDWNSINYHEKDSSMPGAMEEFKAARKQVQILYKEGTPRSLLRRRSHGRGRICW